MTLITTVICTVIEENANQCGRLQIILLILCKNLKVFNKLIIVSQICHTLLSNVLTC